MKEKLIIKNFGPIKSVDLDLGKITVLIGEQATGKSTVAKVLSICRYFSYIVNYSIEIDKQDEFHDNEQFLDGLRNWGLYDYLTKNSRIVYKNSSYKFEFKNKLVTEYEEVNEVETYKKEYFETETRIAPVSKSNDFAKLLDQLGKLKSDELKDIEDRNIKIFGYEWSPNENFYRLNVKKVMDNPLFIPTERVSQSLSSGKNLLVSEAIQDELNKLNRIVRGFNKEIRIEPLSLTYKNERGLGFVKKDKEENYHSLHNGASGYQSTIPIVLAVKNYNEVEKRKRTFIVEEPEQNLFPNAQKKLVEFLVKSINKHNNQFILPTHSPYILTTLSNLIYAHKIGTAKNGKHENDVDKIISKKSWIDVNDISVYYLNDGKADNMVDVDECIINLDNLDNVSEIINKEFDELLEIETQND
ncbi:MAG: ATP-binding protein [Flavobacteriaceae bacterium]|nr:ATP-binding protein [Flavobacteriaceae bacterium]